VKYLGIGCLLAIVVLLCPNVVNAQLSTVDSTDMTTHMEILSTGFVQGSFDVCNGILNDATYDDLDWEQYFKVYFGSHSITDTLAIRLFYGKVNGGLGGGDPEIQNGMIPTTIYISDSLLAQHAGDLINIMNSDADVRESMIWSYRFMESSLIGNVTLARKTETYNALRNQIALYPLHFYKPNTIDTTNNRYTGWLRGQLYANLVESVEHTPQVKSEIATAVGMTGL